MHQNELLKCATEYHKRGDLPRACELYQELLRINPAHHRALYLFGRIVHSAGDLAAASDLFRRAIAAAPKEPDYHNALGLALSELGNYPEAEDALHRAIGLRARPEYHSSLGLLLRKQRQIPEAISAFKRALKQNPGFVDAHYNLGLCYQDVGQLLEAIQAYQSALRYAPRLLGAWYGLGCAQLSQKEYTAAIGSFSEALAIQPSCLEAEHNLGKALSEIGQTSDAVTHFRNCAARSAASRAMLALIIPGDPDADNAAILAERRAFAAWAQSDLPRTSPAASNLAEAGTRPLRIGYISAFFHRENWMKPVWGLINQHDRSSFEVHLFSDAPASAIQGGYRADARDCFHDISKSTNEEVAALTHRCGIDMLVDLNSYSELRRLPIFTLRPAPVVIGWFNLYATSGFDCFDYLIGDSEVIPTSEEGFYTERIYRVPGSYLTFDVNYAVPDVADAPCLATRSITFGSFASQIKITGRVVAAWSRILALSPTSSLVVRNKVLGSNACREFLYGLFAQNGIPRHRVRLHGPLDHFEFLKAYDEIDVALDTFPYNGGTTTTEAIWQGVPVLTFWGDRWVSRTSASILRAGGLGDFVRADLEDYISFGAELANSPETPERLAALRRGMRPQLINSSVCDTRTFAREMEKIYHTIQRATRGAVPATSLATNSGTERDCTSNA